jgi:hypothetical protein
MCVECRRCRQHNEECDKVGEAHPDERVNFHATDMARRLFRMTSQRFVCFDSTQIFALLRRLQDHRAIKRRCA